MNKHIKNAFTMAELTICIIVMIMLAVVGMSNMKPNDNKIKLFVYATMENIASAVSTISNNYDLSASDTLATYDWMCTHLADYFSLKTSANCSKSAGYNVNYDFINNVTLHGLSVAQGSSVPWVNEARNYSNGTKIVGTQITYKYKDFVIDIDGEKGKNEVGVDRFPLRLYRGGLIDGTLIPTDCANFSPAACNNGSTSNGTRKQINFANTTDVISYDIYKIEEASADSSEEEGSSKAYLVASNKSYIQADCGIYGGEGYYNISNCSQKSSRVFLNCLTSDICKKCHTESTNICPYVDEAAKGTTYTNKTCQTYVDENNPRDLGCFMMLHKPGTAGGIFLDSAIETITGD